MWSENGKEMYTTKNRVNRDDTCMPPALVCKPIHSIESVVGSRGYGNGGEPFHISEMSRKYSVRGWENSPGHPARYLEDNSHLCYAMSCITVRSECP